jgi:hypothetical protein
MKKYKVAANDDAMKYQVIDTTKKKGNPVVFEDDGEFEAIEYCNILNGVYEEVIK